MAQSCTYNYNAARGIDDYIKPLCGNNDYIRWNTKEFPKLLQRK